MRTSGDPRDREDLHEADDHKVSVNAVEFAASQAINPMGLPRRRLNFGLLLLEYRIRLMPQAALQEQRE